MEFSVVAGLRRHAKRGKTGHTIGERQTRKEESEMDRKTVTLGVMGAAAVGAAAMLMKPKKDRRVKKALRSVGAAVETISRMIG